MSLDNPLIGNDPLFLEISTLAGKNRLPHAILLLGERGSGRGTLARTIAAMGVCREPIPCGVCNDCRMALAQNHPDVVVFGKDEREGLTIKSLRTINEEIALPPHQARRRVILLRDIQDAAQPRTLNTLLKVIEEPPPYLMFVITATTRESILETIVSRCRGFTLSLPAPEAAKDVLRALAPQEEETLLQSACVVAGGNIGRAKSFLSQGSANAAFLGALALLAALEGRESYRVLLTLTPFERDRVGYKTLLGIIGSAMGALLRGEGGLPGGTLSQRELAALLWEISDAERLSAYNLNLPLTLTRLGMRLCAQVGGS